MNDYVQILNAYPLIVLNSLASQTQATAELNLHITGISLDISMANI